jgi:hypothetical protein
MAKKSGLPENYNLNVNASDLLTSPARIPGYLDPKPSAVFPLSRAQEVSAPITAQVVEDRLIDRPIQQAFKPQIVEQPPVQQPTPAQVAVVPQAAAPKRMKGPRKQINFSTEAQQKLDELVLLFSARSAEKGVGYGDLIEGLILKLYEAKDDIDVSQILPRGKWGTPTAKAFRAEFTSALLEGLFRHSQRRGEPFKSVANSR